MANVFEQPNVAQILEDWDRVRSDKANAHAILGAKKGEAFAARDLLRNWPGVGDLIVGTAIHGYLLDALGPKTGIVRALFFDKPPGNSWALPWHKDYMIAVKALGKEGMFTHPGMARGIPQVKAPKSLLEKMLTVRVHLDDMDEDNGALKVIPGSHRNYALNEDAATEPVMIRCLAGDVLFMRPLLTHASSRGKRDSTRHRRILHLECAPASALADDFEWHDFKPIS